MTAAVRPARAAAPWQHVRELLEMIKFQHSLFALPFAFTGMLAAAHGLPSARVIAWIAACMIAGRTAAMTWNRLADRSFDAANPRTQDRALPAGRVPAAAAWALLVVATVAFVASAAQLNLLTLALSPVALAVILGYSWTKRFTWASHLVLGLSLAIAPAGAWVAVKGRLDVEVLPLCLAVLLWTAGFDILYACQDADFDRSARLQSVPARFGIARALLVSRALHVATVAALVAFGVMSHRGPAFFAAAALTGVVLAWAQSLLRPADMRRVGLAFFQANVAVGALVLTGTALDVFTSRGP